MHNFIKLRHTPFYRHVSSSKPSLYNKRKTKFTKSNMEHQILRHYKWNMSQSSSMFVDGEIKKKSVIFSGHPVENYLCTLTLFCRGGGQKCLFTSFGLNISKNDLMPDFPIVCKFKFVYHGPQIKCSCLCASV